MAGTIFPGTIVPILLEGPSFHSLTCDSGGLMKTAVMAGILGAVVAACSMPVRESRQEQTAAQDPTTMMQQVLRWQMEDLARRRANGEKEQLQSEQEAAYDREMCIKVGFLGPDVDQCVRDSREFRRNPGASPAKNVNRKPTLECVTLGDGEGGGFTDCYQ